MRPIDPADTKLRVRAFLRLFSIPVCAYDRIALSLSLSLSPLALHISAYNQTTCAGRGSSPRINESRSRHVTRGNYCASCSTERETRRYAELDDSYELLSAGSARDSIVIDTLVRQSIIPFLDRIEIA